MKTEYTILRMIETMRVAKWRAWCQLPERRPALQRAETRGDLLITTSTLQISQVPYLHIEATLQQHFSHCRIERNLILKLHLIKRCSELSKMLLSFNYYYSTVLYELYCTVIVSKGLNHLHA